MYKQALNFLVRCPIHSKNIRLLSILYNFLTFFRKIRIPGHERWQQVSTRQPFKRETLLRKVVRKFFASLSRCSHS